MGGLLAGALSSAYGIWSSGRLVALVVPSAAIWLTASTLCAAVVVLWLRAPHRLPQNRRQVPGWVTETHPAGFGIFGFEMGTGLRTFSTTALPHLLAIGMFASPGALAPLAGGIGFGIGRYAMVPYFRSRDNEVGGGFTFKQVGNVACVAAGGLTAALVALATVR